MSHGEAARLIPVFGVEGRADPEHRVASALLATLTAVRPFAEAFLALAGIRSIPAQATVEAFTEPTYPDPETGATARPCGLLRIVHGGDLIRSVLVEMKTGAATLEKEQVQSALNAARDHGLDMVLSISNEIESSPRMYPVLGVQKPPDVGLAHLSWPKIVAEAITVHSRQVAVAPEQSWILHELVRYLAHPGSGVVEFADMGSAWSHMREGLREGRLSTLSPDVREVCERWDQMLAVLTMKLSVATGADVIEVKPRSHAEHPEKHIQELRHGLCENGTLKAVVEVPGTIGHIQLRADLRSDTLDARVEFNAPAEGGAKRRMNWLLRQLLDSPGDVLVDAWSAGSRTPATASISDLRAAPMACVPDKTRPPERFRVRKVAPLGVLRTASRRKPGFIDSVIDAVVEFHFDVLRRLTDWEPPPAAEQTPATTMGAAAAPTAGVPEADDPW